MKFISLNGKTGLTAYETRLVKSLAHHSTHPLSRRIELSLAGDIFPAAEKFRELPGQGIEGVVDENHLKIGSANFVHREQPVSGNAATCVFIALNGKVKGYFQLDNMYRPGCWRRFCKIRGKATPWL